MRKLLFFFLLTVPFLGACESFGVGNPQTEWTTTDGVGGEPPVSHIESTVDWDAVATAADVAAEAADVAAHEARHEERVASHESGGGHSASKPSTSSSTPSSKSSGSGSGRGGKH